MDLQDGTVVLDAYCGSGTIGIAAAAHDPQTGVRIRLVGVERNVEGVRDAVRNAQINGLADTAEFIARDATEYMREAADAHMHVDVVVMDPPRAGRRRNSSKPQRRSPRGASSTSAVTR